MRRTKSLWTAAALGCAEQSLGKQVLATLCKVVCSITLRYLRDTTLAARSYWASSFSIQLSKNVLFHRLSGFHLSLLAISAILAIPKSPKFIF